MRASVFVGASLDGFIARTDGSMDWLHAAAEGEHPDLGYEAFIASVDVIVMGRRTYETVLTFDSWPYSRPVIVLSSRELAPAPVAANVGHMSGAPADVLAALADRGFQHAYVDGGDTIQRFLRDGLIQRVTITRVPVLIGSGISLFGETSRDVRLRLVASRALAGGAVQSEYDVIG
jgi:dihydrofolate reductase